MHDVRYLCFPYCLKRQSGGRYVVLNRRYKPIGFDTHTHVDYEAYPITIKLRMTRKTAAALSCNGSEAVDMIYLYNDACIPTRSATFMAAYLERLARFAKLQTRM